MTNQHPITPPPELVHKWAKVCLGTITAATEAQLYIATQAARWGADQELEACCAWLVANDWKAVHKYLRTARRPKSPSLKEQTLAIVTRGNQALTREEQSTIRRALEQLDD